MAPRRSEAGSIRGTGPFHAGTAARYSNRSICQGTRPLRRPLAWKAAGNGVSVIPVAISRAAKVVMRGWLPVLVPASRILLKSDA